MKTTEERYESKYIRNLRRQIIKLKRENAQLKKKNNRIENTMFESEFEDEGEFYEPHRPEKHEERTIECRSCGTSYGVEVFDVGKFKFYHCTSCESKGRIDIESEAG